MAETTRREFIKAVAVGGTAATALWSGVPGAAEADAAPDWKAHIGLELYTVRDQMAANFEGVLAKVAAMGYKEIEPANGYNNMSPAQFRAMLSTRPLDPSTHSARAERSRPREAAGGPDHGVKYPDLQRTPVGPARGGAARGPPLPPGACSPWNWRRPQRLSDAEAFGPYQPAARWMH